MPAEAMPAQAPAAALLEARAISRRFHGSRWFGARAGFLALDRVSLAAYTHRTLAITGPSGAGKTTLARCLAGLDPPDSGAVFYRGAELGSLSRAARLRFRGETAFVPQHAAASFSPRFTVAQALEEPLRIHRRGTPAERRERCREVLALTALPDSLLPEPCSNLSGGQRTRLALARAVILSPCLLILDEPLTGLDAPLRAQIVNLLLNLQTRLGAGYVWIEHDRSIVSWLACESVELTAGRSR